MTTNDIVYHEGDRSAMLNHVCLLGSQGYNVGCGIFHPVLMQIASWCMKKSQLLTNYVH